MEYRKMEKPDKKVSLLGFGCMRFPMKDGRIDEALSEKMLDIAIKSGVNYLDTAFPYHSGESELFVGRMLSNDCSITKNELKSLENTEFSCQK